jgi:hypothetical protein
MTKIISTSDLGGGLYRMYSVKDEAEATQIADGKKSFLYQSKIIDSLYLFVPVEY